MRQQNLMATIVVLGLLTVAAVLFLNSREAATTEPNQTSVVEEVPNTTMIEDKQNIIAIASGDPQFSTLVTAIQAADLAETLSGQGPFTVFAPTNEAFAKLAPETLQAVLADKEQLSAILTYHVVAGKVMAEDVAEMSSAPTLQGGELEVRVNGNNVMVNNANVIATDIEAENGVIHTIDTVLIPR